jgi:hypothetical protein
LSSAQSGRDEEGLTEAVELGKGGMRKKICLRVRRLKEDMARGEAGRETGIGVQTVCLRRIMG